VAISAWNSAFENAAFMIKVTNSLHPRHIGPV
jgi:hypothetical protein